MPIPGANSPSLTITNVQHNDGGACTLVATNKFGAATSAVVRLAVDLATADAFDPGTDGRVQCLAVQPDGKILVAGKFSTVAGQLRANIARCNPDGSLGLEFKPATSDWVHTLAVQTDSRILLGGNFLSAARQPRANLCLLNGDGSLDASFNPGADGPINTLLVQLDGRIIVGGGFATFAGQPCSAIGRLKPDARILVGGDFSNFNGQTVGFFVRLTPKGAIERGRLSKTIPASDTLAIGSSEVAWLMAGAGPEFWRTSFELLTDGAGWTPLGAGTPIVGGWRLQDVILPPYATLRVCGSVTGGGMNSSSWFLEYLCQATAAAPVIPLSENSPVARSGRFGLDYTANAGQMVVVEHAMDLTNWAPPATSTAGLEPLYFDDPESPWRPRKYYRLRTHQDNGARIQTFDKCPLRHAVRPILETLENDLGALAPLCELCKWRGFDSDT